MKRISTGRIFFSERPSNSRRSRNTVVRESATTFQSDSNHRGTRHHVTMTQADDHAAKTSHTSVGQGKRASLRERAARHPANTLPSCHQSPHRKRGKRATGQGFVWNGAGRLQAGHQLVAFGCGRAADGQPTNQAHQATPRCTHHQHGTKTAQHRSPPLRPVTTCCRQLKVPSSTARHCAAQRPEGCTESGSGTSQHHQHFPDWRPL